MIDMTFPCGSLITEVCDEEAVCRDLAIVLAPCKSPYNVRDVREWYVALIPPAKDTRQLVRVLARGAHTKRIA